MYYRDDGGLGCLIGIFIMLILLSAVMAIILSPVVGILVLVQAISKRFGSRRTDESNQYYYSESGSYHRGDSASKELEDEFTKDAVDVDVEVIPDDK